MLTALAVAVAFLLFGVMHGVIAQFDSTLEKMSDVRLRVMSRANLLESVPVAYRERIAALDGVTAAAPVLVFFGYYQDPSQTITGGGVDVEAFDKVMPEINIPPAQLDAMRGNRIGALVGAKLMERYGWSLGDRITLKSQLWMNSDTGENWTFEIMAVVNGEEGDDELFASEIYVHYDYLNEARAGEQDTVNQIIVGIDDPDAAVATAQAIDAMFANSSDETKTVNEKDYLRTQLQQLGNVSGFVYSILGAVLFTLVFLTGTTMVQSLRERVPELGILKSLGFTGTALFALVMVEALILCLTGALVGLVLAGAVFPGVFQQFNLSIALGADVYLQGLLIATLLAVLVSVWPALRARRLDIVSAIAGR